jgi:hypothetical protein
MTKKAYRKAEVDVERSLGIKIYQALGIFFLLFGLASIFGEAFLQFNGGFGVGIILIVVSLPFLYIGRKRTETIYEEVELEDDDDDDGTGKEEGKGGKVPKRKK